MINIKGFTQSTIHLTLTSLQELKDFADSMSQGMQTAYIARQSAIAIGIPGAGTSESTAMFGFLDIYKGTGASLIKMQPANPAHPTYYLAKIGGTWQNEWSLRSGGGNVCSAFCYLFEGGGVNVQYKNVIGSPDKCNHTFEAGRISSQRDNDIIYRDGRTDSFISWSFGRNPFKRYVERQYWRRSWGLYSFRRSHNDGWSQRSNYKEHITFGNNYDNNRSITPLRKGVAA